MNQLITNVYLVRHAHSAYTPDEVGRPLSERGFADAAIVKELLELENIDEVYASPYKRALQTVDGIAKYINKQIKIENDFKERILAKKPADDFMTAITTVWEDFDFHWEDGESNHVAQSRGVQATMKLLDEHKGKNIAVGTHGNLMVLIMNYFNKKYDFSFWKELGMPDVYKLAFKGKRLFDVNRIWGIGTN